jgi:hypothetical protein
LDVESSITLLTDYYIGIERQGVGNWIMLDGTFLGNNTPSNSNPYKHWCGMWLPTALERCCSAAVAPAKASA